MNHCLHFLKRCLKHSQQCHLTNQAAALSFDTLLALAPFLILTFHALSWLPIDPDAVRQTEHWLLTHLLNDHTQVLVDSMTQFIIETRTLTFPIVAGLLLSIWLLMHNIQDVLSVIWQRRRRVKRLYWSLLYAIGMLFVPILLSYSLIAATYLTRWLPFVTHAFGLGVCFTWLLITYRTLPSPAITWTQATLGALIATLTLIALRAILLHYFAWFDGYSIIYGAFVAVPLFLIWLFLSWLIILWSTLITYVYHRDGGFSPV